MMLAAAMPARSPQPIDAKLVVAAQAGDRTAMRQLIGRHQRAVGALLRRMLRPAGLDALTEDLAQETFLRVFKALDRFEVEGAAKFSTWLLRIASRLAINELARKRPKLAAVERAIETITPEREHRRRRVALEIERAVSELPPPFRAAFLLREYHGLDYAEIAELLELELGTVKSRLSRARRLLRDQLEELHRE